LREGVICEQDFGEHSKRLLPDKMVFLDAKSQIRVPLEQDTAEIRLSPLKRVA